MIRSTQALAKAIRVDALQMVHRASASHIGSSLSMVDLLAVLYGGVLRVDPARPDWPERDRFVLSKGHAAAAGYATLAEAGFFPIEWLDTYCQDGSKLPGHLTRGVPGVELSTGSLGHGLPVGAGMALAARADGSPARVFVLLSDGELDEGSNWEAILFAAHHGLENLVAIVDYNKIQSFGSVAEVHAASIRWPTSGARSAGPAARSTATTTPPSATRSAPFRTSQASRPLSSPTRSRARASASWKISLPGTTNRPTTSSLRRRWPNWSRSRRSRSEKYLRPGALRSGRTG